MGEMKDLLISGSSNEELQAMVDTARNQHDQGYIQFLEEQLEKAEELIKKVKKMANSKIEISIQKTKTKYLINKYYNDKK